MRQQKTATWGASVMYVVTCYFFFDPFLAARAASISFLISKRFFVFFEWVLPILVSPVLRLAIPRVYTTNNTVATVEVYIIPPRFTDRSSELRMLAVELY